jgi:hypothetical protein
MVGNVSAEVGKSFTEKALIPSLFYLESWIHGRKIMWLVDTGSTVNLMEATVLRDICDRVPVAWEATDARLRAANEACIDVTGACSLPVSFGKQDITVEVLICRGLCADALIGASFLRAFNVELNLDAETLTMGGVVHKLKRVGKLGSVCAVEVSKAAWVAPADAHRIKCRMKGIWNAGEYLIEPLTDRQCEVETCIVDIDKSGEFELDCRNLSLNGKRFYRPDIIIAYAFTLSGKETEAEITTLKDLQDTLISHNTSQDELVCEITDIITNGSEENELRALIPSELDKDKAIQAWELLNHYRDVFDAGGKPLSQTDAARHTIDTGDVRPIKQPPRRVPLGGNQTIKEEIDKMLKDNIIETSKSPWASPIVLVKKKDGSIRFCIDYRKLNAVTKVDAHPLPRIDQSLNSLQGATWFHKLDLKSGYWQIKMDPEDQEKTAFASPAGLFEFKVMPFGLVNAPATFERMMETILDDI